MANLSHPINPELLNKQERKSGDMLGLVRAMWGKLGPTLPIPLSTLTSANSEQNPRE